MLVNEEVLEVQGSLGGEQVEMTVDETQLAHIMSILTNIYSDKIGSIIREYSTNALDSHIASGQSKPVEVTTPTTLSPYLIIRDYGVGMSADDIRNIYSKYGASTKRESAEENGKFGIGCKSALTYADQFTLTGVKDGVKTLVAIGRTAKGGGTMEIVHTGPTDEPNGVTIKIPVNNSYDRTDFERKALKFARFVKDGTILINNRKIESELVHISKNFYQNNLDAYWNDPPLIVMGNVAYPVDSDYLRNILRRQQFVYFAEMGEVDFPPSREELMYTENTKATLERIEKEYTEELMKSVQHEIDACTTFRDAFVAAKNINSRYNQAWDFVWQGKTIPQSFRTDSLKWDSCYKSPAKSYVDTNFWSLPTKTNTVILTNWTNKKFSKHQGIKITKWLEENEPNYDEIESAIVINDFDEEWVEIVEDLIVVDWDEARKIKVEKPGGTVDKPAKKERSWYDFRGTFRVPDKNKTQYYGERSTWNWREVDVLFSDTTEAFFATPSQLPIFLKKYPNAQPAEILVAKLIKEWVADLTPEDLRAISLHCRFTSSWALNPEDVEDSDLKALAKASTGKSDESSLFDYRDKLARLFWIADKKELGNVELPELGDGGSEIIDNYPILAGFERSEWRFKDEEKEHIKKYMTEYVNKTYREELKNGQV